MTNGNTYQRYFSSCSKKHYFNWIFNLLKCFLAISFHQIYHFIIVHSSNHILYSSKPNIAQNKLKRSSKSPRKSCVKKIIRKWILKKIKSFWKCNEIHFYLLWFWVKKDVMEIKWKTANISLESLFTSFF